MGNKHITEYSIDKFLIDLNNKELHNLKELDLKNYLANLCLVFQCNPKALPDFIVQEADLIKSSLGDVGPVLQREDDEENYDNIREEKVSEEAAPRTKRFCTIISRLVSHSFHKENYDIYMQLLHVINYLIEEKQFMKYYIKYSNDSLCNMITCANRKYSQEFIIRAIQFLSKVITIFLQQPKLIQENLTGISKIMLVPKKLIEPSFAQLFGLPTIELFQNSVALLSVLNEDGSKSQSLNYSKDYLDFLKITLSNYYESLLFFTLANTFTKDDALKDKVKIQKNNYLHMIMSSFKNLCKINLFITEQYLKCEKELEFIFTIIDNPIYENDSKLIHEVLLFFIQFYISSFNESTYGNFNSFLLKNSKMSLRVDKLYNLFQSSQVDEIKFLVGCLFLCISIIDEIWNQLTKLKVIDPTVHFMIKYVHDTFSSGFSSFNSRPHYISRMGAIQVLISIFTFITDSTNFIKIYHLDYFKKYFELVMMLFYVNYSKFSTEILKILNVYTYYYDCKEIMLTNPQVVSCIPKRLTYLFAELEVINQVAEELSSQILDINSRKDVMPNEFKTKMEGNFVKCEALLEETRQQFLKFGYDFGLLVSIFTNLMMTNNDYEENIKILSQEFDFFPPEKEKKKEKEKEDNLQEEEEEEDFEKKKVYLFQQFSNFFLSLNILKKEMASLGKFAFQVPLALLIHTPLSPIVFENYKSSQNDKMRTEVFSIQMLYELIKLYSTENEFDILHKLLYAISRFFSRHQDYKEIIESLKKIIEEVKKLLTKESTPGIVNRECLKLICTFTSKTDNTYLWLKFDSGKIYVDHSNYHDVTLKYQENDLNWEYIPQNSKEKLAPDLAQKKIKFLPFLKVKSYADKMGIIFHHSHHLILPKPIKMSENDTDVAYTIWFRFFNPVIDTRRWHTLLQDPTGMFSIIGVNTNRKKLGCITLAGEFIDSGINLTRSDIQSKWVQVAMAYGNKDICWYINGKSVECFNNTYTITQMETTQGHKGHSSQQQILLPRTAQYIGNTKNYDQPFGVFCDLRIFRHKKTSTQIQTMYDTEECGKRTERSEYDLVTHLYHKLSETAIRLIVGGKDTSEETLYFAVKFFNNIMVNRENRNKMINYDLIWKICDRLAYLSLETQKEITKFLMTIS